MRQAGIIGLIRYIKYLLVGARDQTPIRLVDYVCAFYQ